MLNFFSNRFGKLSLTIISHINLIFNHYCAKEMEMPKSSIDLLPSTVKLLCEAGTGYNNIPIEVARSRGISVCNIPIYSNESVAHMVVR